VSHSQPLYSAFERLPSHTRMAALCARAHTHTLIHTHTHKASLEASHNRASHTHSTHTYMPLTPTASLEASLQGASEKAALTQQQLDTTSNELANLQEQAKQQGAALEELHRCVCVRICVCACVYVCVLYILLLICSRGQSWRSCTVVCACMYVCVLYILLLICSRGQPWRSCTGVCLLILNRCAYTLKPACTLFKPHSIHPKPCALS
jgi:hypothetical protein